jgi:hypothetical protein
MERLNATLLSFHGQHLSAFVVTTRPARSVRRHSAATLRALIQVRRMPAVRRLARAQAHLRRFAFWNSHGRRLRKHGFCEKQPGRLRDLLQKLHRYNGPTYNFVTLVTFFNALTSTDPTRSNPICAPRLAPKFRFASACKLGRRLGRNAGGPADSAKGPRA